MKILGLFIALFMGSAALAETVVPTRTIRAQELISREDLTLKPAKVSAAFSSISEVVGLEARVALYPGRPVRHGDVGPPAIVSRNQIIPIVYEHAGLRIRTEGRVLDRAAVGDWVKIMNMESRTTVMGQMRADGSASVAE